MDTDTGTDKEGQVWIVAKLGRNQLQLVDWVWIQLQNKKGEGNRIELHKGLLGQEQRLENKRGYVANLLSLLFYPTRPLFFSYFGDTKNDHSHFADWSAS